MGNKYEEALKNYKYDAGENILNRIKSSNNEKEQLDIINMIILWKINRRAIIDSGTIKELMDIKTINLDNLEENKDKLKKCFNDLISSKGIQLAMASTILHFYNPNTFPIIDQRAYRELRSEEMSQNIKKGEALLMYNNLFILQKNCFNFIILTKIPIIYIFILINMI
ncbi:putative uncharacterized protein [Firmicutes bacterium CAG:631]|nr:putative uncharacterized protein [Firmicutes bacterium CAG:631]